jgi:acetyl-CoA carboxylase carboxyl transferase subunit alpha
MDKNEILNHRKNKFLSIGRNKGFTIQSNLSENLSMKQNVFDKFRLKLKKNNKNVFFIILFLVLIIVGIILS